MRDRREDAGQYYPGGRVVPKTPTGQGGGGTSDYSQLANRPKINNHELIGNKTAEQLGLATPNDILGKLPLRHIPKYLHFLAFDDTYPADAAWLYEQLGPSDMGRCSAVRRGGKLWRNYDWTFDNATEFVVKMSGNATRFASVGVASVGARLTENDVMSAVNSRYYKCLPGMTLDGINEKGVVCEINVDGGPKYGWHGDADEGGIHILAAVRWVLDHGETAAQAAAWIADHIIEPHGEMNFHFMVADATSTYIVENGAAYDIAHGTKVLTNYALFDSAHTGGGKERYTLLAGGEDISAVNFTNAYQSGNDWDSDFDSPEQHAEAIRQWAAQGTDKEAHRGKTTESGLPWWQSVHTTEYDFAAKTMKVAVQEVDDWYVFAVDSASQSIETDDTVTRASANPVKSSGIWSAIWGALTALPTGFSSLYDWCAAKLAGKRDKTDLDVYEEGWTQWTWTSENSELADALNESGAYPVFGTEPSPPFPGWGSVSNLPDGVQYGGFDDSPEDTTSVTFGFFGAELEVTEATAHRERALVPVVGDSLALVSQLPTAAEKAAWNGKRDEDDNTCHKTEFSEWSYDPPLPSGAYIEWFSSGWGFDPDKTGQQGFVYGDETDIEVFFPANSWTGNYDFTATRSVCTINKLFTTFDFVFALVNGVKTLLGSVASGYSTFSAWIASKFDTAKAVHAFAATATYEVGEIVLHGGIAYKCTTAVTTAGAWTGSTNWTAASDADLAARLKNLKSDGKPTDQFATDLLGKQVAKEAIDERLPIPISAKDAGFTTESYKRFIVTVSGDMTVTLHTPTSGDAEIFECRFNGTSLSADASITFAGATAITMDANCGTVTAGKVALMSAFWNGTTWDVNWKVEG